MFIRWGCWLRYRLTQALQSPMVAIALFCLVYLCAQDAWAGGVGLSELADRIRDINSDLRILGGTLALTGFIWALLAMTVGIAGSGAAISMLGTGLAIAFAPQIVEALTGVNGAH